LLNQDRPQRVEHVLMRYGGDDFIGSQSSSYREDDAMLRIESSQVSVANSTFEHSSQPPIRVLNATVDLTANIIRHSATGVVLQGTGSQPNRSQLTGNTFSQLSYPLQQHDYSFPVLSGNTFSDNANQVIRITGSFNAAASRQERWPKQSLPYLLSGGIGIGDKISLQLDAGLV
ncbi:right-handed parallel beta-helix repeat-containing protein, partial [Arthrospira platensis SPKY1]|nr:right-handed parallel beta-helix repeat-containing protein [Arthrospira platensis SPKY1]